MNVAFPFSQIKLQEPSKELAELAALVFDLVGAMAEWVPEDRLEELQGAGAGAPRRTALNLALTRVGAGPRPETVLRRQCRPIDSATSRMVASKNSPGSRTVLRQCPKTSRLIDADDGRPRLERQHHLLDRHAGEEPLA